MRSVLRGLALLPCVCALWIQVAAAQAPALARNSTWKYLASAVDQDTLWRTPGFIDAGWDSGPGILGFGETYIATVVPSGPSNNRYRTTYFRTAFSLAQAPASLTALSMSANYDDGFVLYANGSEIARRALGAGPVTYSTFATSHEGGSYEVIDLMAVKSKFVQGVNTLAVEVHQTSTSSTDLVWDMDLTASSGVVLTRGPYLQSGTPTGVSVRWRTSPATDSRVRYGPSPGALSSYADDAAATTEHIVTLGGLQPDTRYYYSVGTAAQPVAGDSTFYFVTPPAAGNRKPTRIWIIGDSGLGNLDAARVRDAYKAYTGPRLTDLWLMLGDNAYNSGLDSEYQNGVFDMYGEMLRKSVLWPTRGNHDLLYAGADNDYYDIFTLPTAGEAGGLASGSEAFYSFDYGDIHFICLDSEGTDRSVGGSMLGWLRNDLGATAKHWVVCFWHHPPYTKGTHDSDDDADSGGRMGDMRRNALPILDSLGVDLVLCGHSHVYERSFLLDEHYGVSSTLADSMKVDPGDGRVGGTGAYYKPAPGRAPHQGSVYVVAGSSAQAGGGALNHPAMFVGLNVMGSMVVDVVENRLNAVFLDINGVPEDSFAIVKPVGAGHVDPPRGGGLRLSAGAPNPFRAETRFNYTLARPGAARVDILDASGRRVRELVRSDMSAGEHYASWNGRDERGRHVGAGIYYCTLESAGERRTRKVTLAR